MKIHKSVTAILAPSCHAPNNCMESPRAILSQNMAATECMLVKSYQAINQYYYLYCQSTVEPRFNEVLRD